MSFSRMTLIDGVYWLVYCLFSLDRLVGWFVCVLVTPVSRKIRADLILQFSLFKIFILKIQISDKTIHFK